MPNEPYEQKYKATKANLTDLKIRYSVLNHLHRSLMRQNYDLIQQITLAQKALFDAGYRRLDDMSWVKDAE